MIRRISKKEKLGLRKDILKTVVLITSKDPIALVPRSTRSTRG